MTRAPWIALAAFLVLLIALAAYSMGRDSMIKEGHRAHFTARIALGVGGACVDELRRTPHELRRALAVPVFVEADDDDE